MLHTPVAFVIFNRPDTTERVFAEIAKVRPAKLFVIADGPRPDRPGEAEKCAAVRAIVDGVDWECEVFRNYSDVNLGPGRRPATGISWVFEQTGEAIILEDDCVPHPTFFRFCEELLEKYRDDERVMMISGNKWQLGQGRTPHSYYFSRYTGTWGWASWRRAWQHHDFQIKPWLALRNTSWLLDILGDPRQAKGWQNVFDRVHADPASYWDYQWTFACWVQNGLAITPNTNLVSNIGFRDDASHTTNPTSIVANIPTAEMRFPLQHPPSMVRDREADRSTFEIFFPPKPPLPVRLCRKLFAILPGPVRKGISYLRSKSKALTLTEEAVLSEHDR